MAALRKRSAQTNNYYSVRSVSSVVKNLGASALQLAINHSRLATGL